VIWRPGLVQVLHGQGLGFLGTHVVLYNLPIVNWHEHSTVSKFVQHQMKLREAPQKSRKIIFPKKKSKHVFHLISDASGEASVYTGFCHTYSVDQHNNSFKIILGGAS